MLLQSALFSLRGSRNIKKVQRDIKNNDIDIDISEGAIHFHKLEDKTLLNSVMYVQISGITMGQTLQLTKRKCMMNGCSDVQKNDFSERFLLFRSSFIRNGFR